MKRFSRLVAAVLALCMLAGCGLSSEGLYALPRASKNYYDLQETLNKLLSGGYQYAAPTAGARREPVQLIDLDADGADEAVCFLRNNDSGAATVCVLSREDQTFAATGMIEGAGTGVASVEYANLDGGDDLELVLTYQVSESVSQALQVYRYTGSECVSLLSARCSRYEITDMDGDGKRELTCISDAGADNPAILECYDCANGEPQRIGEARLRFTYENLRQLKSGELSDHTGALLFSGITGDGRLTTDIFTLKGDTLTAIVPEEDILTSQPVHSYYVYPEDQDGDGTLEIPQTRELPAYDAGSGSQSLVDWYRISANGAVEKYRTEFRNFSENWTLEILDAWDENLTIKAGDESTMISTVTLYQIQKNDAPQEILTIYTLRGINRQAYAEEHSLHILYSEGETIYAASLAAAEVWEGTITLARLSELFRYLEA